MVFIVLGEGHVAPVCAKRSLAPLLTENTMNLAQNPLKRPLANEVPPDSSRGLLDGLRPRRVAELLEGVGHALALDVLALDVLIDVDVFLIHSDGCKCVPAKKPFRGHILVTSGHA